VNKTSWESIVCRGTELLLLPQRAVYWPAQQALLVADLHLGKAGHFQKHGIAVSGEVLFRDLQVLGDLLLRWQPKRLLILGDLFHSNYNREWEVFADFLVEFDCQVELIRGNHDRLWDGHYARAGITVHEEELSLGPFVLRHEPVGEEGPLPDRYVLCGHLHPGVRLVGNGRQTMRLPCFYFGERQGILPAFGQFTGLAICYPEEGEKVFAIVEGEVLQVN
jgi:DNA ligase-associated metallophosphoesterase